MDKTDILNRVISLLATVSATEGNIDANSELINDLEISSMDVLFLVSSLEEEFKISIPEERIRKMFTVADVVDTVVDLQI